MTDASTPTDSSDSTKSPLDILEEILGKSAAGASDAVQGKTNEELTTEKAELEILEKQKQYEIELQQQQARDIAAIQEKTQELATITQTPAYQARVQQDATTHQQEEQNTVELAGFEINQISRTTIEVEEEAPL